MNIVFMGTPEFALPTLKALHSSKHLVQAVVTQPDRPKGRGRELQPPPIKQYALNEGITVFQPEKASSKEFVETLNQLNPDLIVVIAYGQILRENLLNVPKNFCMNIHASILPKYRGAAPINWAIINGETETGVTTMRMDRGLDTGDMLLKKVVPINWKDTAKELHDILAYEGSQLTLKTLNALENNSLKFISQNDEDSSYAPKLSKENGLVPWEKKSIEIYNLIRGVQPWPGAFTFLNEKRLGILRVEISDGLSDDLPGCIARVSDYGIEVGTGDGRIIIKELRPEGKKPMSAKSFLQGNIIKPGNTFLSHQK